jgi:hypothetical protein
MKELGKLYVNEKFSSRRMGSLAVREMRQGALTKSGAFRIFRARDAPVLPAADWFKGNTR